MKGCNSNICYVDLTTRQTRTEILPEEILLSYLGGRGLNSYLLLKHFKKLKSPLDPDNIIIISAGLFVNTSAPSSGRTCISFLMNAEGTSFTDSSVGGRFSIAMKSAGIDVLFITGKSKELCYILVEDGTVSVKDARLVNNQDTYSTDLLLKVVYPSSRILCIGPAGEALSPFANVMHEDRSAGGAAGSVWGSKNLKAVVAVQSPKIHKAKNQEEFSKICTETEAYLKSHPVYEEFKTYGTTLLVDIHNKTGNFPMNNWARGKESNESNVNADAVYKRSLPQLKEKYFQEERFGCAGCALGGCSHIYNVSSTQTRKLEYEAINCFSGKLGKDNLQIVLRMNTWCNLMGIDYIRATGWLAALVDVRRFNVDIQLFEEFERIFQEISFRPPVEITTDPEFKKRFIEVKGKALSSFDPRAHISSALAAATSSRGGDHLRSVCTAESYYKWYLSKGYDPKEYMLKWMGIPEEIYNIWNDNNSLEPGYQGKEYLTWFSERMNILTDTLGLCKFHGSWRFGLGFEKLAKMITSLTGIEWTWKDLFQVAENGILAERTLLQRYDQKDYLPERFFAEGTESHPPINKVDFERLLQRYYTICNLDEKGYPNIFES